ncbi:MAG: hypothetical protein WC712_10545 [Candidatus Brocadiia bacterium]
MGCKAIAVLIGLVMIFPLFMGCSPVDDENGAVKALSSTSDAKRQAGLDYLLNLPNERKVEIGMELFLAVDPLRGHAGIRVLASADVSGDAWTRIESQVDADKARLGRRYAILSARAKRTAAVGRLCDLLMVCGEADAFVVGLSLEEITGLSFGNGEPSVLGPRWRRQVERRSKGVAPVLDSLLSSIYKAQTPELAVKALRALPLADIPLVIEDLRDIGTLFPPILEREIALMLTDASDNSSASLLFSMLSSPDYLVRYNSYNALVRRTGITFHFDPASSVEQREEDKKSAGKLLGIER